MNKKKKIICIIQARLGSKRFPRKIFKKINGERIINLLYKRINKSLTIDKVIVAIPNKKKDDDLSKYLIKKKIPFFRGSEKNVLNRYFNTAKHFNGDIIIRVTSDCPLLSADIIDQHLKLYIKNKNKIVNNYLSKTYPVGISFSIFDFKSLEAANKYASRSYDKEHVMPYIYRNMSSRVLKTSFSHNYNFLRLTLDYPEDLITIRKVYKHFHPNIYFSWKKVIHLYEKKPILFKENLNIKFQNK